MFQILVLALAQLLMKKPWLFIILAGLSGIFSLPAIAQNAAPVRIWDYGFGGSGYDQLNCLEQTTDGGYILGGFSDSGLNGDKTQLSKGVTDYWIIRTDSNGTKRWDKTIGGSNGDYLYTIKQTSDEGFILGGWSESGSSGDKTQVSRGSDDYWIVKLDSNGTKLWDKSFGGASHDLLRSVYETADGSYILGGMSDSPAGGDKSSGNNGSIGKDFWIIKLDDKGNKLWDKTIGGTEDEVLSALHLCTDGSYLLAGYSASGVGGNKSQANLGKEDYWLVKLDAQGNKVWDKTFGGSGMDLGTAIVQIPMAVICWAEVQIRA